MPSQFQQHHPHQQQNYPNVNLSDQLHGAGHGGLREQGPPLQSHQVKSKDQELHELFEQRNLNIPRNFTASVQNQYGYAGGAGNFMGSSDANYQMMAGADQKEIHPTLNFYKTEEK